MRRKEFFMIFFPRSSLSEKRHRPRKWNFLTLHASNGMNIEIVCVELWNSQIEHSNGKFSSLCFAKLASSCCSSLTPLSMLYSAATFWACCKIYLWKLLWYFLCVWVEHLKKQHIVINSSNIEFILENIIIKFSCKENCSCCVLLRNLWDNLVGNLNVHT